MKSSLCSPVAWRWRWRHEVPSLVKSLSFGDDDEQMSSLCSSVEARKRLIAVLAVSSPGNDKQFGETPLSQIESLQTNCNCQIAQFWTIRLFYLGARKPTSAAKRFQLTVKLRRRVLDILCHILCNCSNTSEKRAEETQKDEAWTFLFDRRLTSFGECGLRVTWNVYLRVIWSSSLVRSCIRVWRAL